MRRWLLLSTFIAGLVLLGLGTLRGEMLALAIPLLIYAGASLLGHAPSAPIGWQAGSRRRSAYRSPTWERGRRLCCWRISFRSGSR